MKVQLWEQMATAAMANFLLSKTSMVCGGGYGSIGNTDEGAALGTDGDGSNGKFDPQENLDGV